MDLQKIKTLLDFVGRSQVSELTVSQDGTTVIIRNRNSGGEVVGASMQELADGQAAEAGIPTAAGSDAGLVCSPVSGVVHQSNSPAAAPLVSLGDRVEAGQGLCIVEAMKVFTTVPAPFGGIIKRIYFEDGQEIGFGQPLVEIG